MTRTPATLRASDCTAHAPRTLAERLRESRLRHRQERLLLVLVALDERVAALDARNQQIPRALTAAINGFRKDLGAVGAELRSLDPRRRQADGERGSSSDTNRDRIRRAPFPGDRAVTTPAPRKH